MKKYIQSFIGTWKSVLKGISWPDRDETTKKTLQVVATSAVIALVLGGVGACAGLIFNLFV